MQRVKIQTTTLCSLLRVKCKMYISWIFAKCTPAIALKLDNDILGKSCVFAAS